MARRKKTTRTLAPDAPGRKNLMPPIKKGEVRNPTGKNGSEWLTAFRDFFAEVVNEELPRGAPDLEPGDTRYRLYLKALFRNAMAGSDNAIKLGFEQLQGRARQHVEVSGNLGNGPPVQFLVPENGRDIVASPVPPATEEDDPEDDPEDPTADE